MRVHLTLLFFLLISINSIANAQEGLDSSQVNSAEVISQDLGDSSVITDILQEREISQSDYYRILYAIVIFILAFIVLKYLKQPLEQLSDRGTRFSGILKQFIPILLTFSWFIVIYIIIVAILKLSFISSLIIMAVLGIAIAFSFQDVLKDLFAGIVLPFESHLEVGNKIQIGDLFGEIIKTDLLKIQIKKSDGNVVIIQNSILLKEAVNNVYTEKDNCPTFVNFYLPLSTDLNKCREIAYKSAIVSPYLFLNKAVTVIFSNEATNGQVMIKMSVKAYLQKIEFIPLFTSELTETVIRALINEGVLSENS